MEVSTLTGSTLEVSTLTGSTLEVSTLTGSTLEVSTLTGSVLEVVTCKISDSCFLTVDEERFFWSLFLAIIFLPGL